MEILFLKEAREMGFDPDDYSRFPPLGEILARVDFMAWVCASQGVFFREEKTGARYCITLQYISEPGAMSPYAMNAFFPYLRKGDLCRLTISQNKLGGYCLGNAVMIEQRPVCHRRQQCEQPSPCCVFKS